MSTKGIEAVLNQAMSDSTFADQLFSNPDQALAGFELTAEESDTFKGMVRADFDKLFQASPEDRKSFALTLNHSQTALHIFK